VRRLAQRSDFKDRSAATFGEQTQARRAGRLGLDRLEQPVRRPQRGRHRVVAEGAAATVALALGTAALITRGGTRSQEAG
jgi:hypothetical protein